MIGSICEKLKDRTWLRNTYNEYMVDIWTLIITIAFASVLKMLFQKYF